MPATTVSHHATRRTGVRASRVTSTAPRTPASTATPNSGTSPTDGAAPPSPKPPGPSRTGERPTAAAMSVIQYAAVAAQIPSGTTVSYAGVNVTSVAATNPKAMPIPYAPST
jgi:hypothetical protein